MLWVILTTSVTGCAAWSGHGIYPSVENGRVGIAVLPVEVTAQVNHLADITTLPDSPQIPLTDERIQITAKLEQAGARLEALLNEELSHQPSFAIAGRRKVTSALSQRHTPDVPLDDALAAGVGRRLGVPMVLRTTLSGYGKLKRRWTVYLIGSGVVEGLVQGLIAARVTNNTWVAVGLAVEEIAQEVLTWGGGAYLFNRHYAPVTLEARLIASGDGALLWHDVVFVGIDRKALKAIPDAQRERRETQLQVTADKAGRRLAKQLAKAIRRHTKDTTHSED